MQLTIRLLGTEVLHIHLGAEVVDEDELGPVEGDCTTYPLGFTASPGDQRYAELDAPDME